MGAKAPPGLAGSGVSPYWPNDLANYVVQGEVSAIGPQKAAQIYGPFNVSVWPSLVLELTLTGGALTGTVDSSSSLVVGVSIASDLLPAGSVLATVNDPAPNDITVALPIYTLSGKVVVGQSTITDLYTTDWLLGATVTGPGIQDSTEVTAITVAADPTANPPIKGTVTISNPVVAPTNGWSMASPWPFEFALAGDGLAAGVDAAAVFGGGGDSGGLAFSANLYLEKSYDGGENWVSVTKLKDDGTFATILFGDAQATLSFVEPERGVLYRLNVTSFNGSGGIIPTYRFSTTGQAATSLAVPV